MNEKQSHQLDREQLTAQVTRFIVATFPAASDNLALDESLLDSGIVDSMGVLEIVTFLETEMNCSVSDEDMIADNFESVVKIVDFIAAR